MKYSPMLCKLIDKPFDDKGWIFESKIDGVRIIAIKNGVSVKLLTRNNKDKAKQFPEIATAIRQLKPGRLVLDGEIAAFRKGISSFQAIQPRIGQTNASEIQKLIRTHPVKYIVFDLLNFEGENWETKPLLERKQKLKAILSAYRSSKAAPKAGRVRSILYLNHIVGDGVSLFKKAKQKKREGIVGKKKNSRYSEGKRGNDWVKIKTHNQQEFVIGAYTPGQGKTKNTFGAVLVGYYKSGKLIYAGKVGTGFTDEERSDLKKRFMKIQTIQSPFNVSLKQVNVMPRPYSANIIPRAESSLPAGRQGVTLDENIVWLKPKLVGEFAFGEWTKDNILRQPVYMGLRIDKSPESVTKEN